MIVLLVTYFGSLGLAALAWDKSLSKLATFLTGLISAPVLVTIAAWVVEGFSWENWEMYGWQNLYWGVGIGVLNGWFVGNQFSKPDR
jgi:hypothetical protein